MFYDVARFLVLLFVKCFFTLIISGEENIPKVGPAILCPNHKSNWDPVVIGSLVERHIAFMAKSELFSIPVLRHLLKWLDVHPVNRSKGDLGAVRTALSIIKKQSLLLIFPEGQRIKKGRESKPKPGVVKIAQSTGAVIIPVSVKSSYKIFSKVEIDFLPPLIANKGEDPVLLTNELMRRIYND